MRSLFAVLTIVAIVALVLLRTGFNDRFGADDVVRHDGAETSDDGDSRPGAVASPAASRVRQVAELATVRGAAGDHADWSRRFGVLAVHVVGAEGAIAGASVGVPANVSVRFVGELDEDGIARTDAVGIARFYVRPARTALVSAAAPGSVWTSTDAFTTPFAGDERTVTLTLAAWGGDELRSLVVRSDPYLAPIEGAGVAIRTGAYAGIRGETSFVTDVAGRVDVPWRAGVTYDVTANGHAAKSVEGTAAVFAGGGPVHVDLKRNARLHGRLLLDEAARGSRRRIELKGPLPSSSLGTNNTITIDVNGGIWSFGQTLAKVDVGPDGRWAIEDVVFPWHHDVLEDLLVVLVVDGTSRPLTRQLTLRPGDDVLVVDEWGGSPGWTITVLYASGEPLAAGSPFHLVELGEDASGLSTIFASAGLDRRGRARFDRVPVGTWGYTLSGSLVSRTRPDGQLKNDGSGESVLVLDGLGAVQGRVEGADGAPIP